MMLGGNLGASADAPVVNTHWWCPSPGAPVSYLESFLGCPSVNGIAPAGAMPSDVIVNPIVYDTDIYKPPAATVPNPAVGAGTSTTPAPYDCSPGPLSDPHCPGYDAALAASTAAQKQAQDAANAAAMAQVLANIKAQTQAGCPNETLVLGTDGTWSCPSSMSLTTIALLIGGGIVAALLIGRPR